MKNIMRKIGKLLPAVPVLLLLASTLLTIAFAAGARLYLSPASGTYYAGSYIPVQVTVDAGGNPTNVYRAALAYSENLVPVSVDTGGSICPLWLTQTPDLLECGTFNPYSGAAGRIATVNFLAQKAGPATVSISGGNVKKADGAGTEILNTREAAEFTVQDVPEGTPAISSATHPDQNAWYPARTAELSWTAPNGAQGFSYALDQDPFTVPDDSPEGTEITKTYENLEDGIYYFHLKAQTASGWSFTNHFRIQIDGTAPEPFAIVSDPAEEKVFRAPLLSFFTTDATSGVDRYEISIDGGEFAETASPYRFDRIRSGAREVIVRAFDRAGNYRDAEITLMVIGVNSPTIITPAEGDRIPLFGPLPVRLEVSAAGTVELSIDGDSPVVLKSTGAGELSHRYMKLLLPGSHALSAVYINADGIESEPAEAGFSVNPLTVYLFGFNVPGYIFYPILLAVLAGLFFLGRKGVRKLKARMRARRRPAAPKTSPEKAEPEEPEKKPENKETPKSKS